MAKQGTPEFYRTEATRLALLALDATDPSTRLQILEIAASLKRLADYVASNRGQVMTFAPRERERQSA